MIYEEVIIHGAFNALWIVGVWNAALPGQILDPIATWMAGDSRSMPPVEPHASEWITKPLFECPMCMASLHGLLWWLLFQPFPLILLPVYIVCLSGLLKVVVLLVLNKDS